MKKALFSLLILAAVVSCKPRTDAEKVASGDAKKAAEAIGNEYSLVTSASTLKWIGSKPTGEHNGTVQITSGRLSYHEGNITSGNFSFDLNTIVVDDLTDAGMNAKLTGHLKSEDFFHVAEYPTASFEIVSVNKAINPMAPASGGVAPTHDVTGNLTMRGTTKSITFPVKIETSGNNLNAVSNPFAINRTEWNVNYMSKSVVAGLVDNMIDDNIIIQLDLEFVSN